MFDAIRNNKRVAQVFLGLITLPFALWGVESYIRNFSEISEVATVGKEKITPQQYNEALRQRQDSIRQSMGGKVDAKLFDTPEFRRRVIEDLVDQRLMQLEVRRGQLFVGDAQLRDYIAAIPALQEGGQFSQQLYEQALAQQGMSRAQFEGNLRRDLVMQQLGDAIASSGFLSNTTIERLLATQSEEREVSEIRLTPAQYQAQVKVDDAAARKFYDDNPAVFQVPEQVKAEFVTLSLDDLMKQVSVSEADIAKFYDDNRARFQEPEQRRASHILISAGKSAEEDAAAKTKAEALLKEVQAHPEKFAEVAKRESKDPGSAQQGGDLGFFNRDAMVKPFADAAFQLKEGELSGVVKSDFGYHIIKLTGIKAAAPQPLAQVRSQIEGELKRTQANQKYVESAEGFANTVYDQSDSLKPVADKYKLTVQQSDWLIRQSPASAGLVANPKLLAALFSDDALKSGRNTEAVEVAPNVMVAARVLEHKPASQKPFESVKADVIRQLSSLQAQSLAAQDGEAKLTALRGGKDGLSWGSPRAISRSNARESLPNRDALNAVFKADTSKLPAYAGVSAPDGSYVIYRISKVTPLAKVDDKLRQGISAEYGRLYAQADFVAYVRALRERYKVEINQAALEGSK